MDLKAVQKAIEDKYCLIGLDKIETFIDAGYIQIIDNTYDLLDYIHDREGSIITFELLNASIKQEHVGQEFVDFYINFFGYILRAEYSYLILNTKLIKYLTNITNFKKSEVIADA